MTEDDVLAVVELRPDARLHKRRLSHVARQCNVID